MEKKKRGANFSAIEKELLLQLVKSHYSFLLLCPFVPSTFPSLLSRFNYIIENKKTDAISVKTKFETWKRIADEFNCQTIVPRSFQQLKNLYENLKRCTRKEAADENKKRYEKMQELGVSVKDSQEYPKIAAVEKKERKQTGGGSCSNQLSEIGCQVLAILGDQVQPLENVYDSAADYFGDVMLNENLADIIPVPESNNADTESLVKTPLLPTQVLIEGSTSHPSQVLIQDSTSHPSQVLIQDSTSTSHSQKKRKRIVKKKTKTYEKLRIIYIKKKIQNENLKRNLLMREHQLQMKIYRRQLEKLQ